MLRGKWVRTEEFKKRLSLIKQTPEQKAKAAKSWKGKKRPPFSDETRRKMSEAGKKRRLSVLARQKISLSQKGKKPSLETRKKMSNAQRKRVMEGKHNFWRGGKVSHYPELERIRKSQEYKIWRNAVYERDNWTCIWCKKRGGKLNADHIKPFSLFPELRFAIDNGRTLCINCHRKIGWNLFRENNPNPKQNRL